MYNDNYKKDMKDTSNLKVAMPTLDENYVRDSEDKKHWEVTDTVKYGDGTVEKRVYHNTVVDDCSKLLACLLKGQAGHKGITYWAVGSGENTWSDETPPSPTINDTKLLKEVFRKAIEAKDITFLDSENKPTESVTNKLEISITFKGEEANGALREFALFGGDATEDKDSGIMINRKTHGLIYKTSNMELDRKIRITL